MSFHRPTQGRQEAVGVAASRGAGGGFTHSPEYLKGAGTVDT